MKTDFLKILAAVSMLSAAAAPALAQNSAKNSPKTAPRQVIPLEKWHFRNGDCTPAEAAATSGSWQEVTIPHDWAIAGPFIEKFDESYAEGITDAQARKEALSTVNVGGLPYVGVGCYATTVEIDDANLPGDKIYNLEFDGAMSNAKVYVNGEKAIEWPCGYNNFSGDITSRLKKGTNIIFVRLENEPQSSRWYPGAGLYRNARLIKTSPIHVAVRGTYVTTPFISEESATVSIKIDILDDSLGKAAGEKPLTVRLRTVISDADGKTEDIKENAATLWHGRPAMQNLDIEHPKLWSPETPCLYTATTEIYDTDGNLTDCYVTRFGVRKAEFIPDKGFFLNGKPLQFKGVCLHHDLGSLGSAVSKAAIVHRLEMLKDMGCNAIRTSHNMPAPELVEAADEMGFMMMVEAFDEWDVAKCANGYHKYFDEWAERDIENMVRRFRNNPSVIMWSIGNEVPSQGTADGWKTAMFLQDICHREDPTRPVTCGNDQFDAVVGNGFAAIMDIPGFNYKPRRYGEAALRLPQGYLLGTESASTVSSRGVYGLPYKFAANAIHPDRQSSSYDNEFCYWSNIPEYDFAADEDCDICTGQFVWTGFDYIGEPTPYNGVDGWPNHTSLFGIIDLAEIPKDRYYLYRSVWNTKEPTLHILPHWNWNDNDTIPVCVYTSWPAAELFVNGVSQGIRKKSPIPGTESDPETLAGRYRLLWPDVRYEAGEVMCVALDKNMQPADTAYVRTAGKPHHLELKVSRTSLSADGRDLAYVTVSCVDKKGGLCPNDSRLIKVNVTGSGTLEGIANGDPTCLESFKGDRMHLFGGQLTFIVRASGNEGTIIADVTAEKLRRGAVAEINTNTNHN